MTLQITIPEGLDPDTIHDLDIAARETIAVRLYQQGKLSHGKLARFLNIDRAQADALLTRHGIVDEFSAAEIADQVSISRTLRSST